VGPPLSTCASSAASGRRLTTSCSAEHPPGPRGLDARQSGAVQPTLRGGVTRSQGSGSYRAAGGLSGPGTTWPPDTTPAVSNSATFTSVRGFPWRPPSQVTDCPGLRERLGATPREFESRILGSVLPEAVEASWPGRRVGNVKPLGRFAHGEHRAHQVEQRPGEVVLGDQHLPVTHAKMVNRAAGNRPVWRRGSQRACDEFLPSVGVAAASGVNHPAPHGAVPANLGHHDPHQPSLLPATRTGRRDSTRNFLHDERSQGRRRPDSAQTGAGRDLGCRNGTTGLPGAVRSRPLGRPGRQKRRPS
jgi:hypothetical protein